jgi:hypothetical protein
MWLANLQFQQSRRNAARRLVSCLIVHLLVCANVAFASDTFIPQCPGMLLEAESFAKECLINAREFSRTFYPGGLGPGQPETHSAYFKAAAEGSHFALGCTLNKRRQIQSLGIYYSVNGDHFAKANTARIRFIDLSGNVGLEIDSESVTLLAIRQFAGSQIALRHRASMPKNCESPLLPNGYLEDASGQFKIEGDLAVERPILSVCRVGYCHHDQFIQFFMRGESQIIHHEPSLRVLIGSAGNIVVQNEYHERSCGEWHHNLEHTQDVVSELCGGVKK